MAEDRGGPVRLSVNLAPDVANALTVLAERHGKSITGVVRDAIATAKFLSDEREQGGTILIREKGGTVKRVVEG